MPDDSNKKKLNWVFENYDPGPKPKKSRSSRMFGYFSVVVSFRRALFNFLNKLLKQMAPVFLSFACSAVFGGRCQLAVYARCLF